MEMFKFDKLTTLTKELLSKGKCSLCSVVTSSGVYKEWNDYITYNYTTTQTNNNTNYTELFDKLKDAQIDGRNLELSMPLFMIANEISYELFEEILLIIKGIVDEKRTEEFTENSDIFLIDFVSQEPGGYFVSINDLVKKFREFLQSSDDWINNKWLGRALKRLNLIKEKKRKNRGIEVKLDITKAQEKIRMFR